MVNISLNLFIKNVYFDLEMIWFFICIDLFIEMVKKMRLNRLTFDGFASWWITGIMQLPSLLAT